MLRAEWTKFRTLPGSLIALLVAVALTVALGVLTASGTHSSCPGGPCPKPPVGPGGEVVNRFRPRTIPDAPEVIAAIEAVLPR